jgi:hypothetical protein
MPTKYKKDGFEYTGGGGVGFGRSREAIAKKYYISHLSKSDLFEMINSGRTKPKLKQKCRNELQKRGVKIIKIDPTKLRIFDL